MHAAPQKERSVFAFTECTLESDFTLCIYLFNLMNQNLAILDKKHIPCSKKESVNHVIILKNTTVFQSTTKTIVS